jgi:hypothetical protein
MPVEKDPLAVYRGESPILETSTSLISNSRGAGRPAVVT